MCNENKFPTIAAAIVMCRYDFAKYAEYCSEEVAMDMVSKPTRRELLDYAMHFKAAKRGEFDKCLGAVFFEALARKNDKTSCFRIARYYRDGRHVPQNTFKSIVYLKRAAALGLVDAHVAISKSSFDTEDVKIPAIPLKVPEPSPATEIRNPIAMYAKGKECEDRADYDGAMQWYRRSLAQNYYCAYGGIIRILLNPDWSGFNILSAEEAAEEAIEVHPPVCSILVAYYAEHVDDDPEYREKIERMLLRMYVKGYTPAQNIVKKYKKRGII